MKIKKIKIIEFENIHNKTLEFDSELNILFVEKEQDRLNIHAFIECMLFGAVDVSFSGIMWIESDDKNYRITRDTRREEPYSELFCEDSGELVDIENLDESEFIRRNSEEVFENMICISSLKGNTGAEIVREVQREMRNFQTTSDCSIDLTRSAQYIKMTRKGYQVQAERRKKSDEQEKKRLRTQIARLQKEIQAIEKQNHCENESERGSQPYEDRRGYLILDKKIAELNNKTHVQTALVILTLAIAVAVTGFLGIKTNMTIVAAIVGIFGIGLVMGEMNLKMRTNREIERKKRMRAKWISKHHEKVNELSDDLREELKDKNTELFNLTEEIKDLEESAYLPLIEETEIDALDLTYDTIEKLSDKIYTDTGSRLIDVMSEILNDITDGQCKNVIVDDEFHISVETGNNIVPIENLRLITVGQVYLSFRLAAAKLMYGDDELPVILGEMFATFDPNVLKPIAQWLKNAKRQIIVSTCHRKEVQVVENTGFKWNTVTLQDE